MQGGEVIRDGDEEEGRRRKRGEEREEWRGGVERV